MKQNWIVKYQEIETMLKDMKITKNWMNSLPLFYNRKIPQSVCINVLREKFVPRKLSNSQQYLERWHNNKSPGHDRIHLGVFKNSKVKLLTDKICNLSLNHLVQNCIQYDVQLLKRWSKGDLGNYRPVHLRSVSFK